MSNPVMENEEDVKLRIIEWLKDATDLKTSISLEKSFTLKVGKSVYKFDSDEQVKHARGRYDILVTSGDRNLLIAEIKHPNNKLTDEDRDQGISYARLLHKIAPYVLVTNGREHRLYDTLSKNIINPKQLSINNIPLMLPDDLLAEAQEIFFRLDESNLSDFCKSQCESTLELIEGTLADNKKHVPELKVDRANVRSTLIKFINSDNSSLTIIGDSGSGKTCELASTVHYLQGIELNCLFFNGSRIESTIQNELSNTYDWNFNDSESTTKIIKRLAKIGRDKPIIIVVDGIDEITAKNTQKEIENILSRTRGTGLKFIFSCKIATYHKFTQISQLPTEIKISGETLKLKQLSDGEFKSLVENYDTAFNIKPTYSKEFSLIAKKNILILRLMYQIAADSGTHVLHLNSNEIIDQYIDQQLYKCSDNIASSNMLNLFASLVYNSGRTSFSLSELPVSTPPVVCNTAFMDLVHNGLLTLDKRNSTSYSVSFNFEQVQNYVIAFSVLFLHEMTADEIQAIINEFQYETVQDSVLSYYYNNIQATHREAFEGDLRTQAENFLRLYDSITGQHLKAIDTKFEPDGTGKIGIALQLDIKEKKPIGYGFRRVSGKQERVVFIPTNFNLANTRHDIFDLGVSVYSLGGCPLVKPITKKTVISDCDLYRQTLGIVSEGDLYEGMSTAMLNEKITALIEGSSEGFRKIQDNLDRMEPVPFNKITEHLLKRRLSCYFEQDYIDKNIIPNQPVVNGMISFTLNRTTEYREWLKSAVETAIKSGDHPEVPYTHTSLDKLTEEITTAIKLLEENGIDSLQPSKRYKRYSDLKRNALPKQDLTELGVLVAELHNDRRDNFKILINSNFPTLSSYLIPSDDDIFITLETYEQGPRSKTQIGLNYYHVDSKDGRSMFVNEDELELLELGEFLIHNGTKHRVKIRGGGSLESFIEYCDLNSSRFGSGYVRCGAYTDMHKALTNMGEDQFKELLSA